jgi:hypothetical protein
MDYSTDATPGRVALGAFLRIRPGHLGSTELGQAWLAANGDEVAAVLGTLLVRLERLERRLAMRDERA